MAKTVTADDVLDELFFTAAGEAYPIPHYAVLHELGPLHRYSRDGLWYATSYETCRELLRDPRVGHDEERLFRRPGMTPDQVNRQRERVAEAERDPGFSMISENPPSHTRMRRLVSRAFTTPRIEQLRARVVGLVDERLDAMADGAEVDIMEALAFPLPVTVISELVGVPESEREHFRVLANSLLPGARPGATEDEMRETQRLFDEMEQFFDELIDRRRADPQDDLISALIAVRDEDEERLSRQELVDTLLLLQFAGFITTTSLIGNGLLALLRHQSEMARLWADESLVVPAVEEFLRYDGPIDTLIRDVLEPIVVEGVPFGPDDHIIVYISAANHDPARFPDPDRLDLTRPDNQPLSFGWGIHHCLGAPLARLEAQVAFSRMRERFSRIDLLEPDPRRVVGIVRRPESLRVRVHAR